MEIRNLFDDEQGVSPVIGVILMVAITVILAAVIATFVLGLGENLSSQAPQASFSFDYEQSGSDTLTITHDGGDTIDATTLNATISGESVSGATNDGWGSNSVHGSGDGDLFASGDVSAGTTDTVTAEDFHDESSVTTDELDLSGATVKVVYSSPDGGSSATLGNWEGPDA
ncbi:type IV pilin [Haloarcula amylovorans]|uniref:type IV pilin n=1 Tax=Haloarcula amylovorans TaxID=2562280 RepID=UPI001075DD1D|nr:type IV pilin N-terminal domain-containing protein [Halomicroarcula amylolytica]